jgi:hypothetical protein
VIPSFQLEGEKLMILFFLARIGALAGQCGESPCMSKIVGQCLTGDIGPFRSSTKACQFFWMLFWAVALQQSSFLRYECTYPPSHCDSRQLTARLCSSQIGIVIFGEIIPQVSRLRSSACRCGSRLSCPRGRVSVFDTVCRLAVLALLSSWL